MGGEAAAKLDQLAANLLFRKEFRLLLPATEYPDEAKLLVLPVSLPLCREARNHR